MRKHVDIDMKASDGKWLLWHWGPAGLPAPVVVGVPTVHNWVGGIGNGSQEPVAVCYVTHPGVHVVLHLVSADQPYMRDSCNTRREKDV